MSQSFIGRGEKTDLLSFQEFSDHAQNLSVGFCVFLSIVIESRCVNQCERQAIIPPVLERLDAPGARERTVANHSFLSTKDGVDELFYTSVRSDDRNAMRQVRTDDFPAPVSPITLVKLALRQNFKKTWGYSRDQPHIIVLLLCHLVSAI